MIPTSSHGIPQLEFGKLTFYHSTHDFTGRMFFPQDTLITRLLIPPNLPVMVATILISCKSMYVIEKFVLDSTVKR